MSTCYVAIWDDRHSDTTVYVFSEPEPAIEWAKVKAREMDRFGDLDERMTESMRKDGWLYRGQYSCEGYHIRVEECIVDKELATERKESDVNEPDSPA